MTSEEARNSAQAKLLAARGEALVVHEEPPLRVRSVQTIIGVYFDAIKSIDATKHRATFELRPEGVLVSRGDGKHGRAIVPYQNIAWIHIEEEAVAPVKRAG